MKQATLEFLRDEFIAAIDDARFDLTQIEAFVLDAPQPSAEWAKWWAPTNPMGPTNVEPLNLGVSPDDAPHRIAVWGGFDCSDALVAAAVAGQIRHELAHARQWSLCDNPPFSLNTLFWRLVREKRPELGESKAWGHIANYVIPIEQDANAVASAYLRQRFPDEVEALLTHPAFASLVRLTRPPGHLQTLTARMVALLFIFEHEVEEMAEEDGFDSPGEFMEAWAEGAGMRWACLHAG